MPDHWRSTTLGESVQLNAESIRGCDSSFEFRYIDIGSVSADVGIDTGTLERHVVQGAPSRAQRIVRFGDVLVSTVRPNLRASAPVPASLDGEVASTGFAVLRAGQEVEPRFVWAVVRSEAFVKHLVDRATGSSYPAVRAEDVGSFPLELPPFAEQRRIADLIGLIDRYIDSLQAQVEATRAARSALLAELLAKPGDDWQESTLGDAAVVEMGQSPPGDTYNLNGDGLPFLQGSAEFGDRFPSPDRWCSAPTRVAEPGDLLVSVRAPVGDTNFADTRLAIGRGLARVRSSSVASAAFLRLVIQVEVGRLNQVAGGGMFASITAKNLRGLSVALPPIQEQRRIVDLIGSIDEQVALLATQANSAQLFRGSAMSELLSGERVLDESYDVAVSL